MYSYLCYSDSLHIRRGFHSLSFFQGTHLHNVRISEMIISNFHNCINSVFQSVYKPFILQTRRSGQNEIIEYQRASASPVNSPAARPPDECFVLRNSINAYVSLFRFDQQGIFNFFRGQIGSEFAIFYIPSNTFGHIEWQSGDGLNPINIIRNPGIHSWRAKSTGLSE